MEDIKKSLKEAIEKAVDGWCEDVPEVMVMPCRAIAHGDVTTNICFLLAAKIKKPPQVIALSLVEKLHLPDMEKIEAVGGYINFTVHSRIKCQKMLAWLDQGIIGSMASYGGNKSILMEFVSSNPTGPLHVGHGRQAAVGDVMARIFRLCGFRVDTEYYVNDAGMQMDVLITSVWVRILQSKGIHIPLIQGLYQGDYLIPIAQNIMHTLDMAVSEREIASFISALSPEAYRGYTGLDVSEDIQIELLKVFVSWAKQQMGAHFITMHGLVLDAMMAGIVQELQDLGVVMDCYASERSYVLSGAVDSVLRILSERGHAYTKEGAVWFSSTSFGDDKDRVLVRSNGENTYFINDIAYHWDKIQRGYDGLINFLGSDHHGYVVRITAALKALGVDIPFDIRLVQFVHLIRGGERISMSTRRATFETLSEVVQECGRDATRYFYLQRYLDQTIDFDMDLAIARSQENPVYYVQYAHARLCRILEKSQGEVNIKTLYTLTLEERDLWDHIGQLEMALSKCMEHKDPYYLTAYVYDLAKKVHFYYNNVAVLQSDDTIKSWRLIMVRVARDTLALVLDVMGIHAPGTM